MLNKKKNRTNWMTNWCPKHLEITKKLMKNLITVIGQKVTERETFQQKRCQEITKVITISDISNTSNIYSLAFAINHMKPGIIFHGSN